MELWKIADLSEDDQEGFLAKLDETDAFWVGASYAVDPCVGMIYKLPLRDPLRYGGGVPAAVFDKLVKNILSGALTGDPLVLAIETFSKHCQEDEWKNWYRPILEGNLDLKLSLDIYNKYCPDRYRIPPPSLNVPKSISALSDLPEKFVLQPVYPGERGFWIVEPDPIQVRGYDSQVRRYYNCSIIDMLTFFAKAQSTALVIIGVVVGEHFLAEDVLTYQQFAQEGGTVSLHKRLEGLKTLGLPTVQLSAPLSVSQIDDFYNELNLIFQQKYQAVVVRDLGSPYPFHSHSDLLIKPKHRGVATVQKPIAGKGFYAEYHRGKKHSSGFVRLGLTNALLESISETLGRRFEFRHCGIADNELILPVFETWKDNK